MVTAYPPVREKLDNFKEPYKSRVSTFVSALIDDRYMQGNYGLAYKRDGQYYFTTFGVLCDISNLGRWVEVDYLKPYIYSTPYQYMIKNKKKDDVMMAYTVKREDEEALMLPRDVLKWIGFTSRVGYFWTKAEGFKYPYDNYTIHELNDSGKYTLPKMAEFILDCPFGLFVPSASSKNVVVKGVPYDAS